MRLIAALNHNPRHFLASQNIKGVSRVSYGLATYIIRGGNRYFDFRSMGELIDRADTWVANNMFKALPAPDRNYIDALAAIRNCVVHRSDAAMRAYRRSLREVYNIRSAHLKLCPSRCRHRERRRQRFAALAVMLATACDRHLDNGGQGHCRTRALH